MSLVEILTTTSWLSKTKWYAIKLNQAHYSTLNTECKHWQDHCSPARATPRLFGKSLLDRPATAQTAQSKLQTWMACRTLGCLLNPDAQPGSGLAVTFAVTCGAWIFWISCEVRKPSNAWTKGTRLRRVAMCEANAKSTAFKPTQLSKLPVSFKQVNLKSVLLQRLLSFCL